MRAEREKREKEKAEKRKEKVKLGIKIGFFFVVVFLQVHADVFFICAVVIFQIHVYKENCI